jgi:hypothetical protein
LELDISWRSICERLLRLDPPSARNVSTLIA